MEDALKAALGTAELRPTGHSGGGCISQGRSYDTDLGRVFVKSNSRSEESPLALPSPYFQIDLFHIALGKCHNFYYHFSGFGNYPNS
ncbi:hypothetical protein HGM15179_017443 [Zosterops borbonicus]|uniref:Uncharacterized protein n=1 Tax=Zosterops borbonicus TaxID=364589 RepID=A0A8K1LDB8_9PASS|nr:hypothetical protein HGM15179_017443 [Zosterops borbonicus]